MAKKRPLPKELKPVAKATEAEAKAKKTATKNSRPYRFSAVRIVILLLILLIPIGVFIGVTQLTQNQPVKLDQDQTGASEMITIDAAGYDALVADQKTAIIFVDQTGCTTADGLRSRLTELSGTENFRFYRLMWSDLKQTALKDVVKYYPSIVILSHGTPVAHLRADSDEDSAAYNSLDALDSWLKRYLLIGK